MSSGASETDRPPKEAYGDSAKFRLAGEFWRIVDDLMPSVLAGLDYITEFKSIDAEWVETMKEVGGLSLELKFAILGFKSALTKDDSDSIRDYDACLRKALERAGRNEIQKGQMEGRAELFARRRLALEDRGIALYYQVLDMRAVAFKNKMWDTSNRPYIRRHQE